MQALQNHFERLLSPFHCSLTTPSSISIVKRPPDLPPEIWLEIFQFATYVHQFATIAPLDPFTLKRTSHNAMGTNTPSLSMRTKLSLVLVCQTWRRITLQLLYEHVVIRSPARANAIVAVLQRGAHSVVSDSQVQQVCMSEYGKWTRHIEIYTHARGTRSIDYLQTIFRIFRYCPNLRMLSGIWIHPLPIEFLDGIAKLYGPSLQGLYWHEQVAKTPPSHTTAATPEFLASFHSLRVLDLRNYVGSDLSQRSGAFPTPTLPRVQHLVVSTHPQSLAAATVLSLPALRYLTLKTVLNKHHVPDLLTTFLGVHGHSLISIDLPSPSADSEPEPDTTQARRTAHHVNPDIFLQPDLCPNLETLTFPTTSPPLSPNVHPALRRIGLRGVRAESLHPNKATNTRGHLMSFTPTIYPNLEIVRTVGFLVDADTDFLIKDIFIWWTEKFERHGIDFLDGEGVLWAYTDSAADVEDERGSFSVSASIVKSKPREKAIDEPQSRDTVDDTR